MNLCFFFKKKLTLPERVETAVIQEHEEYLLAQQQCTGVSMAAKQPRSKIRWQAPVVGTVKVNWDATVCEKNQTMGIGVVIRDSKGEFLACLSSPKIFYSQPIVSKFWAL